MKKFTLAAFTAMLAAFAAHADPYTFELGTDIPLKTDDSQAAYVEKNDCNVDDYAISSTHSNSSLTLTLNNETEGDYVLTMKGTGYGYTTTFTLTVQGKDSEGNNTDYTCTASYAQRDLNSNTTSDGDKYYLNLYSLPEGTFTVTLRITSTTDFWAGNYGYFNIVKPEDINAYSLGSSDYVLLNTGYAICNVDAENEGKTCMNQANTAPLFKIVVYCPVRGLYSMSFDHAMNDSPETNYIEWRIGSHVEHVECPTTGGWGTMASHTISLGILDKGYHLLTGAATTSNGWKGIYGNIAFTKIAECKTVAANGTWELEENTTLAELTVGAGATIDLKGHDLTVMTITDADTASYTVTNSVEGENNLSVFTAATEGQPYSTLDAILTGNLKYVSMNGTTSALYMLFNTDRESGKENTLTGGMAVSNMTIDVQRNGFFGTGPLALVGGGYVKWTGNNVQGSLDNSIEVSGEGNRLEAHKGFTWSGSLTGDGEISVACGFAPQLKFEGDTSAFTGKFICAYSPNSSQVNGDGGVYLGSSSHPCDLSKAEVQIHRYETTPANGSLLHIVNSADAYLGNLTTDSDSVDDQQYSILYGHREGGTTLHIGGKNEDGTFAGLIKEYQDSDSYRVSVDKVGTGTWTIKAAQTYQGATTVSEGTLILAMDSFTNSVVTVKSGAMIGGTAVIDNIIFEEGGALDDEDAGVTVKDYSGWPSLKAATQVVNATDTKGKWRIVKSYDQTTGYTTFKRQYFKNGLVIIIR